MRNCVFYDRANWYAVLAFPANAVGHTVLVRKARASCPVGLTHTHTKGFEQALSAVLTALRTHYRSKGTAPKDVLIASLRVKVPHVHWHLIPLWADQEQQWRATQKGKDYQEGRIFEYLGDIDRRTQSDAKQERSRQGLSEEQQRRAFTRQSARTIAALRKRTGYRRR